MILTFSLNPKKNIVLEVQLSFLVSVLTWVEIDKSNLRKNIQNFKRILKKKTKFFAVVKSNAYGHGMETVVDLIKEDVDGFAINHIQEFSNLYELTEKPFLIMGEYDSDDLKQLLDKEKKRFFLVVSNKEDLKKIFSINIVNFFLKVDTGMSRLGYKPGSKEFLEILNTIRANQIYSHHFIGLMTHFSNVEDVTEQDYAYYQLNEFEKAKSMVKKIFSEEYKKMIFHTAASAATMLIPESQMDLVRIGISLYGLWPSLPTKLSAFNLYKNRFQLSPVLTWKTKIVHINEVPANTKVGYGCTYQTSSNTKIAVLPVGYYEGYTRSLSNQSFVIVRNYRCQIIGRVCMNMIMADVSHVPDVHIGEEVILLGSSYDGKQKITADDLAELTNTINYEVVTKIHPSIPRILKN